VWDIDFDFDATISAPVVYGSFGEDSTAEPLIAGVLHGVEVGRAEPCPDDPGPDCGKFVAGGCALFTP
jgi:hypothetical protein